MASSLPKHWRSGINVTVVLTGGRYLEFNEIAHCCLHLMPFVGLCLDFWAEMDCYKLNSCKYADSFRYRRWQGLAVVIFGTSYLAWLIFLYTKNKRWVYYCLTHLSYLEFAALAAVTCLVALVSWRVGKSGFVLLIQ
jgi:hypothetical protein